MVSYFAVVVATSTTVLLQHSLVAARARYPEYLDEDSPKSLEESPRSLEEELPPRSLEGFGKKNASKRVREYVGFAAPDMSGMGWLSTNQNWGKEAKQPEFCPEDTFAVGFQLKFDAYRFFHDNTAVNGIRLFCAGTGGGRGDDGMDASRSSLPPTTVTSLEGNKGEWMQTNFCPNGEALDGGTMTGDPKTGLFKDDASVLNLEMYCGPDPRGQFGGAFDAGMRQRYEGTRYIMHCPDHSRICGLKTTVNLNSGIFVDEVGLTNVQFYCCKFGQK